MPPRYVSTELADTVDGLSAETRYSKLVESFSQPEPEPVPEPPRLDFGGMLGPLRESAQAAIDSTQQAVGGFGQQISGALDGFRQAAIGGMGSGMQPGGAPEALDMSSPNAYKRTLMSNAQAIASKYDLPANIIAAIPIQEAGYGGSDLTRRANNLFSIKGEGPAGSEHFGSVWEVINGQNVHVPASFRKYNSASESFEDFAKLMQTDRYRPAVEAWQRTRDPNAFIQEVQRAGYATDPTWASKVASIASEMPSGGPMAQADNRNGTAGGSAFDPQSVAEQWKGLPYVFGGQGGRGRGITATDCSGFVAQVFKEQGIDLPAHTDAAYNALKQRGQAVDPKDAQPGDVVFYMGAGTGGAITHHMGMYAGPGKVLDMSVASGGGVKERPIGHAGEYVIMRDPRLNPPVAPQRAEQAPPIIETGIAERSGGQKIKGVPVDQALSQYGGMAYAAGGPPVRDDWSTDGSARAEELDGAEPARGVASASAATPSNTPQVGPPPRDIRGDYAPRAVEAGDFAIHNSPPAVDGVGQAVPVGASDYLGIEPGDFALPATPAETPTPASATPPPPGAAVEPAGVASTEAAPASSGNPIVDLFSEMGRKLSGILQPQKPDWQQGIQDVQGRATTEPTGPLPFDDAAQRAGGALGAVGETLQGPLAGPVIGMQRRQLGSEQITRENQADEQHIQALYDQLDRAEASGDVILAEQIKAEIIPIEQRLNTAYKENPYEAAARNPQREGLETATQLGTGIAAAGLTPSILSPVRSVGAAARQAGAAALDPAGQVLGAGVEGGLNVAGRVARGIPRMRPEPAPSAGIVSRAQADEAAGGVDGQFDRSGGGSGGANSGGGVFDRYYHGTRPDSAPLADDGIGSIDARRSVDNGRGRAEGIRDLSGTSGDDAGVARGGGPRNIEADQPGPVASAPGRADRYYHGTGSDFARPEAGRMDPPTTDRYYHGTGSDFARPDVDKADTNGLFGPGYYVTSDPRVSADYAIDRSPVVNPDKLPEWMKGDPDIKERADSAVSGPNIRPIDLPRWLNLLDADVPMLDDVVRALENADERRFPDAFAASRIIDDLPPDADYHDIYRRIESGFDTEGDVKQWLNNVLAGHGYDGIRYAGGKRIPMTDEAGKAIEHNAVVIFPESLDKITNATARTPGGLVPGTAPSSAGATGVRALGSGVGAGYQESQQEGATPESVLRAGAGAAATSLGRSALGSRAGIRAAGNVARVVNQQGSQNQPHLRVVSNATDEMRQSGSPELIRLADMMDELPPKVVEGRPIASGVERMRQTIVRKLTDSNVTMDEIQKDVARATKGTVAVEDRISALMRLNPDSAVDMQIQDEIMEHLRALGPDRPLSSAIATLKQNIDQAAVKGASRKFSGDLTAAQSKKALEDLKQALGPQRFAEMERSADQLAEFNRGTLEIGRNAHMVPDALAADLNQKYPHYSPTVITKYVSEEGPNRVPVGKTVGLNDNGLKALSEEGTTSTKQDPWEASVAARYDMMRRVKRNAITEKFIETARADPDLSQHVKEIITREQWQKQGRKLQPGQTLDVDRLTPDQGRIGWFDKDSVKHEYLIDDWAKPLIEGQNLGELNAYQRFLQEWRSAVTDRSLGFTERNAPRDAWGTFNTMIVRGGGPSIGNVKKVVELMAESYRDAFKGVRAGTFHGNVKDYLGAGGGYARASGRGLEEQAKTVDEIARTGGVQIKNPMDFYRWATDPLSELNKRLELGPRGAIFKQEKLAGGSDISAVIAARDLMPYEVAGEFMRVLNRIVPFLTARIAGSMSQVRLAAKYPKTYLPTTIATTVAPAIAIEMYNRMDEDRAKAYDDVPDYLKYLGNVIMLPWAGKDVYGQKLPNYLFLPTGPVSPFSILGHAIGGAIMGKDARPNDYAEMFNAITESMSPVGTAAGSALSQGLGPVGSTAVGLVTGKDPFRGSEVATSMGDLEATRASQGIAAGANAVLSKVPVVGPSMANVRPSQVEYAARNLTGGPGAQILAATDVGRQRAGESSNIQDMPVIGGLVSPLVGNRTGGTMSREADRIMASDAGRAINDAGVKWRPTPVDDHLGAVGLTRSERGELQRDTNAIFNANVVNIRTLVPGWDDYDKTVKEEVFKNLYANARAVADGQLIARYPDRFTKAPAERRVLIERERKAS